jgi:hypothetical protein
MKKTKLLYVFLSVFFVFILNPEKAFSLASASQNAVNQSFVEKNTINYDNKSVSFGKTALAFFSLGILVKAFGGGLALINSLFILSIIASCIGISFAINFIINSKLNKEKKNKKLAIWGIILSIIPFILIVISYFS